MTRIADLLVDRHGSGLLRLLLRIVLRGVDSRSPSLRSLKALPAEPADRGAHHERDDREHHVDHEKACWARTMPGTRVRVDVLHQGDPDDPRPHGERDQEPGSTSRESHGTKATSRRMNSYRR